MSSNPTLFLFFLSLTLPFTLTSPNHDTETDIQSLIAFRASTNDPLNTLQSWNASTPLCEWNGVTCSPRHQRVMGLNLANRNLTGSLSPHIGNLSFLQFLHLYNNSYTGSLPLELGRLKRLRTFSITNNLINGEIPSSLSNCTSLSSIIISYNKLSGNLPLELGFLSKLAVFSFSKNTISGPIPPSYGNLSSLTRLYGGSNNLSGSIPSALGRLTGLELLAFGENRLSGSIPDEIFNLSRISTFDLAANQLQGSLPHYIGLDFPKLEVFSVGINLLTGSIPASFSNATGLTYLHFGYNNFSGEVPNFAKLNKLSTLALSGNSFHDLSFISNLVNSTNLAALGLNDNNFQGPLPGSFWNLSNALSMLFLTDNQITGTILPEIGRFLQLQDLRVNNNRFTGRIPSSIVNLQSLRFMDFTNNIFSGSIPSTIGNLSNLVYLYLSVNNLSNSIPSSLANCQNLLELNLSRNLLSGPIDREVFSISSLRTIDLSQNQLTDTLPLEIGNLKNLEYFNVSSNNFSGNIPSTLGGCVRLEFLDMRENSFQGNIPSGLSSLRGLQILDLSNNELNGPIPGFLEEFNLVTLNLSFNDFTGNLPENGIFSNASVVSVIGNPKLCGGMPVFKLPKCNLKQNKESSLSLKWKIVISTIGVLLGISTFVAIFMVWCLKRGKKVESMDPYSNSFPNVSFQALLQATDGFSEENLLGLGSYGSVYKGILGVGDESRIVAVKVLNLSQHGALKSFLAECEALRNIRHRNLVRVLTACSGIDFQGNDFKALVYEYMSSGSLDDWLHEEGRTGKLNLIRRLNVAVDVAVAIDYLHVRCGTPIVHCDIKPSNVLLDDDLVARVGDFGLARFLCGDGNSFSMQQTSGSSLVRGTIGYTAPEYGTGSEPSTHGDVYSFGILLLEMFTGKRPTDEMFRDGFRLHSFVRDSLPDRVTDIVDPTIPLDVEMETESTNGHQSSCRSLQNQKVNKCLVKVLGVGVACSSETAKERMSISDAISELQSIRNALVDNRDR